MSIPKGKPTPKEKIEDYEYYKNGFNRLCGHEVVIVNVRKRKDKYIADVILRDIEAGKSERYNDCEYPRTLIDTGR